MNATTTITKETERHSYEEWRRLGRQVKKGARRGADRLFGFEQTKALGRGGPRTCARCGCGINYGVYCGKCEFGR